MNCQTCGGETVLFVWEDTSGLVPVSRTTRASQTPVALRKYKLINCPACRPMKITVPVAGKKHPD